MQDSGCTSGGALPLSLFIDPGINKALASKVGLASFDSFGSEYSGRCRCISVHMHGYRFRRHLLFLGVGLVYASQKLSLGLHTAVIIDQHNMIVEKRVQGFTVPQFVGLIPCLQTGGP